MPEDVPTIEEFAALAARVAALEAGATQPPSGESADGTSVTTAGPTITDSIAVVWDLVDGGPSTGLQVRRGGTVDRITYQVRELAYYDHVILHRSDDGWYSWSDASNSWSHAQDPTA